MGGVKAAPFRIWGRKCTAPSTCLRQRRRDRLRRSAAEDGTPLTPRTAAGAATAFLAGGAPVGYFGNGAVRAEGYAAPVALPGGAAALCEHVRRKANPYVDGAGDGCGAAEGEYVPQVVAVHAHRTDRFIMGDNFSTHASRACYAAGVTRSPEISGVDAPTNLYNQIISAGLVPWRSSLPATSPSSRSRAAATS